MRTALAFALVLSSCARPASEAPPLKAASADAAGAVVRALLDAAQAGDATRVAGHMCGARADALARATVALGGALAIEGYLVAVVEPAWVGAEPYFKVEVTLKRLGQSHARSLSVRAREGCVDRSLGDEVFKASRPDPQEIAL